MANEQEQLVRQVAEQVLSALGKTVIAAPIHPPVGTCTGDYSKFEELRGKPFQAASPAADPKHKLLRGVVTAKQLEGRGAVVRLASCARLTPLALDYVRANGITLERGVAGTEQPHAAGSRGDLPWVWWSDGRDPNVERVTGQLRMRLKPLGGPGGSLAEAVRKMARRVKDGQAAGAVLFVDTAAVAACLANRCPSLRAVVGTCAEAAEQGVRLLGANVLIIEHPYHGWKSMRGMIDGFIGSPRSTSDEVERQLREMAACD